MTTPQNETPPNKYRWPWILLALALLGLLLVIIWVLGAVRGVKRIKESTGQNASLSLNGSSKNPGPGPLATESSAPFFFWPKA